MASAEAHCSSNWHGLAFWRVDPLGVLPADTRLDLINTLYGNRPMFFGDSLNTVAVAMAIAVRIPHPAFIIWAAVELLLAVVRALVLIAGRRAVAEGREGPTDLHLLLGLARATNVGIGMLICLTSGDWVVACLACVSGGMTAVGNCFRNVAVPRLVAAIVVVTLGPCMLGALLSGEAILVVAALQMPICMTGITLAAYEVNRVMVRRMLAERENDRRARHDPLTGALNRAGLGGEVARRIGSAAPFTLFYLDIDGFKGINDSFGHQTGDALLRAVADRLILTCRPQDVIARIGGDEFVLISEGAAPSVAEALGRRLVAAVSEGFVIGDEAAFVGASIGAAFFPDHGKDLGGLLGEADAALYQAKFSGRARCVIARSAANATATPLHFRPENIGPKLLADRNAA